jgi:hypothetical protein
MAGAVLNFQRGQIHLVSKSAKDYLALSVAEAGLHCVLAEMQADYQFVTHGNPYIPQKGWTSPSEHKNLFLKSFKNLKLSNNGRGTYSGKLDLEKMKLTGEFRVRVKLIGAKNSKDSKTVDEAHRYFLLEAVGKVDKVCRKISTVIEKITPGNFLLYDGQFLDLGGYGPYRIIPGEMNIGRIYGHELINFTRRGPFDRGIEFQEMERISTPGHIKAKAAVQVQFRNKKRGTIKSANDSTRPDKFNTFPEKSGSKVIGHFVLDGYHGAKSEKLPPLNPDYYRNARKPKPVFLKPGASFKGFKEAKWKNPAKPSEVVYDLFFGWDYKNKKDKVLLYSTVPLRIWGNPPWKALTIFCEKDVYICGDFNANRKNPQNYTLGFKDYSKEPRNGTDKNGVMVLSQGRIWFDYSNPMRFLRNEFMTLLDYEIAMRLGGDKLNEVVLASVVYPPRFNTSSSDKRLPYTALNFSAVSSLFSLPKQPPEVVPLTMTGIAAHPALKELRQYLKPSSSPEEYKNRFCIKSNLKRIAVYEGIGGRAYMAGTILKGARDKIIEDILDQAEKEMDKNDPDPTLGPWNAADRLFKKAVKLPKTGFKMPEMTVNALLIDSAELNARWNAGNMTTKIRNEIGNIQHPLMRSFPFMSKNSRLLLKHHGGMIHLRTRPGKPFLTGSLRNDQPIVRRLSYDKTYVRGGGEYFPPYPMAGFGIISWKDESVRASEFKKF